MKIPPRWILLLSLPVSLEAAQPWQEVTQPSVAEAAAAFPKPPREYGAISWAIWGGQQTKEGILADIERVDANGAGVYMIDNSGGLQPKYFTPEYLDLVKFAVDECKKRGIKVWIEGDAGYPDGFAGGMISKDYPQLGMQGIVADAHYSVAAGQTLSIPVPPDIISGGGYGMARFGIRKEDCSLRAAYSEALGEIRADGQMSAILKKYGLSDRNLMMFTLHP